MSSVFVLLLAAGLIATINCACDKGKGGACDTTMKASIKAAGTKVPDKCNAYKIFLACLKTNGCSDDADYKGDKKTAEDFQKSKCNSGSMVTASISAMFFIIFSMLLK